MKSNNQDLVSSISDKNSHSTLHSAARIRDKELCTLILEKRPSAINDIDSSGCTAVHIAAQEGFFGIVELCLSKMSIQTIYNSLYIEYQFDKLSDLDNLYQNSNISDSGSIILQTFTNQITHYISQHIPKIGCPNIEEPGFDVHTKLLKFYHLISTEFLSHKDQDYTKHQHKDFFSKVKTFTKLCFDSARLQYNKQFIEAENFIIDKYFMLKGVCKIVPQGHLFSLLNSDCMKDIISLIEQKLYYPEHEVSILAGQTKEDDIFTVVPITDDWMY